MGHFEVIHKGNDLMDGRNTKINRKGNNQNSNILCFKNRFFHILAYYVIGNFFGAIMVQ
jgi:hypothetical protein